VKGMAKSTFAFLLSLLASVAAYSQSRLDRRLVRVPVEINNIPATFLVDTGAERTVVDSVFARQLGLKLSEAVLLQGDYSTNEGNAATANQVRIRRKLWSDVPLVIQDLNALLRMLAGADFRRVGNGFGGERDREGLLCFWNVTSRRGYPWRCLAHATQESAKGILCSRQDRLLDV
jgi:hypothetical protein